ncbi:MAG TPA: bifunctional 4-hydroxy-2-oxoglutarate aldolase/2-dehydro-3-deoxy-phosphogluconate aldolase [Chitinophagaceae bacterium]
MTGLSHILKHKIVAIIRGADPGDVLEIAKALYAGGTRILEVTFNSPNALAVVKDLSVKMPEELLIGMGTVLDAATAREAISAGAKFIISPSFNVETIQATKELGAVSIPGAYTATEIVNAYNSGGDIIKVFPASSNVNYIKDIRAPLPHIPLMPTGGVSLENIGEFQKAGAVAFGIGTALVNTKEKVTGEYLKQLTEKAQRFVQAVANL